jgi:hypothetical protein
MTRHAIVSAMVMGVSALEPSAAQTVQNPFDKAPPDVEDSLRARATEFYQYHLNGKYRLAEQLVAEDAKDGFYAANKPDIKDFRIGEITFSEGYTKAKITIVAKMNISFMGMGAKLMDVPFPSYWKMDGGKWCWYIYNDPKRMTPFGPINSDTTSGKGDPSQAFKPIDISTISGAVKADQTSISLGTVVAQSERKVVLTNTLSGAVKLSLDEKQYEGINVKLEKTELKGGETTTLLISAKPGKRPARLSVGVIVQPVNQMVQIEVK